MHPVERRSNEHMAPQSALMLLTLSVLVLHMHQPHHHPLHHHHKWPTNHFLSCSLKYTIPPTIYQICNTNCMSPTLPMSKAHMQWAIGCKAKTRGGQCLQSSTNPRGKRRSKHIISSLLRHVESVYSTQCLFDVYPAFLHANLVSTECFS